MEHLWAPWRMAYIDANAEKDQGCVFCVKPQQSQDHDEENLVLYRGERCFVLMNLFPYNNGHLMIAPYAHVPDIEHLDAESLTEMMLTAQKSLAALRAAIHPDGFNMGINQGTVAGAGIADHVHFHVVPRWNGDTNFMTVVGTTRVLPEDLPQSAARLRPIFAKLAPR